MVDLSTIVADYPPQLHSFKRFILREYLQHKILSFIYASAYAKKLIFLGGTCLRIVHGNTRFSEDLDFDNVNLLESEFKAISELIGNCLEKEGYSVEIKQVMRGAFHCYVRFPGLLYDQELSKHEREKLFIALDTDSQRFDFQPEAFWLNRFDVFVPIQTTPLDLLLAQKFLAVLERKRNKGRDFFDIVFLLAKGVVPNYDYLGMKLNITTEEGLKKAIVAHCERLDMQEMANDVARFLFNPQDVRKVQDFLPYFKSMRFSAGP